jgi:hypothetical protein
MLAKSVMFLPYGCAALSDAPAFHGATIRIGDKARCWSSIRPRTPGVSGRWRRSSDEEWQTQEGDARARGDDGETKRYLPKKAWENRSEEEKRETGEKKREGSRVGRQHVPNTEGAKKARKDYRALPMRTTTT